MNTSKKILFCQRTFALSGNWESPRSLHTFANRTSRPTDQNLQESAIFTNVPKASIEP